MKDLCQELYFNFTFTSDYKNFSLRHFDYPNDKEVWKVPDLVGCIKLIAYTVIIVGGLLGNISIILTVALNRSMRTTINLYIGNLAVADAFICMFCMVPHALEVITENVFVLGEFMCKFNPFTQMMCLTCSVLTLSAIACDRFMAILFPLYVRITKQRTSLVMSIVWAISIFVSIPFLFVKKHIVDEWKNFLEPKCIEEWPVAYFYDNVVEECDTYEPLKYIYYVGFCITLFFLPILIMITAYTFIVWRIWRSEAPGEQLEARVNAHSKSKRKVIKMVISVLVAFIICWTPIQATALYSAFGEALLPDWFFEFRWFSYYIAYTNSFVNPIIYGGFNKTFRDGFCYILQCNCKKERLERLARWRSTLSTRLTVNSIKNGSKITVDSREQRL